MEQPFQRGNGESPSVLPCASRRGANTFRARTHRKYKSYPFCLQKGKESFPDASFSSLMDGVCAHFRRRKKKKTDVGLFINRDLISRSTANPFYYA